MVRSQYGRKDRLIKEKRHDVYLEKTKIPEPTLCTECGSLFESGRWTWNKTTREVFHSICPACRRILDKYPAGFIEIKGIFFSEHRTEILNLIHNIEKQEKGEHALERIINTKEEEDHILVTTTGIHLARRIGEALSRSYKGDFSFQYANGDKTIRVYWER
jgi:NMD protein affecting ribosome stability and mRNA decay